MTTLPISRRALCGGAAAFAATFLTAPGAALARPEPGVSIVERRARRPVETRTVRLVHQGTGERYRGLYYENGRYIPDVMSLLDWILRDVRADRTRPMDPRLIDVLARMTGALGVDELRVTSAYRSRETNERLRRRTGMAVRNSYHIEGMAADVYVPGVSARRLARVARGQGAGGVGCYPDHHFVHVDVGPVRSWMG